MLIDLSWASGFHSVSAYLRSRNSQFMWERFTSSALPVRLGTGSFSVRVPPPTRPGNETSENLSKKSVNFCKPLFFHTLVPRPLPDFISQLWRKTFTGRPGDVAIAVQCTNASVTCKHWPPICCVTMETRCSGKGYRKLLTNQIWENRLTRNSPLGSKFTNNTGASWSFSVTTFTGFPKSTILMENSLDAAASNEWLSLTAR